MHYKVARVRVNGEGSPREIQDSVTARTLTIHLGNGDVFVNCTWRPLFPSRATVKEAKSRYRDAAVRRVFATSGSVR
jgi:hypothetical protein